MSGVLCGAIKVVTGTVVFVEEEERRRNNLQRFGSGYFLHTMEFHTCFASSQPLSNGRTFVAS